MDGSVSGAGRGPGGLLASSVLVEEVNTAGH